MEFERALLEKLVLLEREDILDHQDPLESKVFPELLAKKVERYGLLNMFTSDHSRVIIGKNSHNFQSNFIMCSWQKIPINSSCGCWCF